MPQESGLTRLIRLKQHEPVQDVVRLLAHAGVFLLCIYLKI